jgi:hypothetical protein
LPRGFTATWNGGERKEDLILAADGGEPGLERLAISHFAHGILTFHVGYLFRTDPGWALLCRGSPNHVKDGIAPLDGLIETDWLPFSFTMNWRFTRPGSVRFERGEPFCFIMPVPHLMLDEITPELVRLDDAPELKAEHEAWVRSRADFIARLEDREAGAVAQGWQRYYVRGARDEDTQAAPTHRSRRRLAKPREKSKPYHDPSGSN